MAKVTVLGCGGFGTALAVMCQTAGHAVTLWCPFRQELDTIRAEGENRRLLPGVPVPPDITMSDDIGCALDSDLVLLAVPSFAVGQTAERLASLSGSSAGGHRFDGTVIANVGKGFDPHSQRRLSEVIGEQLPNPVVALSGPSHAEEVARGVPTTIVAASARRQDAEYVQDLLMNGSFRIYVNDDVIGVELGGALKNVIALAAGIADGLHLGDNAKAALMTRGITEIARLGVSLGAKNETFAGLSGIGDLIVTCTSMHSRNRRAGILIGEGKSADEAIREVGMTVEGYMAAKSAYELAQRCRVEMPIIQQTYQVLYEDKDPTQALRSLMDRPKRHESEVIWLLTKSLE